MSFTSHLVAIAAGVAGVRLYQRAIQRPDSSNTREWISTEGVGRGPLASDAPDSPRSSQSLSGDPHNASPAHTVRMPDLTQSA
jgi:hypothetical protein